jgi:SAM-dependent methyltransferase
MNSPTPALVHLLANGLVPEGRALVPGCGRGYDVVVLASPSREVYGLDIAGPAIVAANEYLASSDSPHKEKVHFVQASFFDLPSGSNDKFDFIYDYTFLCALDPEIRGQWARKMADLVKPGGVLVTLIYPICDKPDGPPFKVSTEVVRELLEPVGFEHTILEMLPSNLSHKGRDGTGNWNAVSALGRWVRKGDAPREL